MPKTFPRFIASGCLALLSIGVIGVHAGSPVFDTRQISFKTLPNGLRVVVRETPGSGLAAVQLWVRGGSRLETPATSGMSHVLEHLVFQGSREDSVKQVVEDAGGTVDGETDKDSTKYSIVVPSDAFDSALKSLRNSVMHTDWSQRDLLFARDEVMREILGITTDPIRVANELAFRTTFQKHPYRLSAGGSPVTLQTLTLNKLKEFHSKLYVAKNMSLVVVGDVSKSHILSEAMRTLGDIASGDSRGGVSFNEGPWSDVRELKLDLPVRLAVLTLSFPGPGIEAPDDVWAMDVLVTLLGDGRRSRLNRVFVTGQQTAIAADAQFITRRDPGLLTVTLLLPPANVDRAQQALLREVEALHAGEISDDEIKRAKATLEGTYAGQNETSNGQASSLGFYEAISSYGVAVEYPERVRKVTAENVRAVAKKYLSTKSYGKVLIRPGRGPSRNPNPLALAPTN